MATGRHRVTLDAATLTCTSSLNTDQHDVAQSWDCGLRFTVPSKMAWFFFDILERFASALASGESETIWQLTMPSAMVLETAWRKGLWI
jgi:hypothetical protein